MHNGFTRRTENGALAYSSTEAMLRESADALAELARLNSLEPSRESNRKYDQVLLGQAENIREIGSMLAADGLLKNPTTRKALDERENLDAVRREMLHVFNEFGYAVHETVATFDPDRVVDLGARGLLFVYAGFEDGSAILKDPVGYPMGADHEPWGKYVYIEPEQTLSWIEDKATAVSETLKQGRVDLRKLQDLAIDLRAPKR